MEADARPGGAGEPRVAGSGRPVTLLRLLSWPAALAAWAAFVLFCVALSFSRGLCCADDGSFAVAAKNIATGAGYLKPVDDYTEVPYSTRFNPHFGLGPTLIVPCAVLLRVFGVNETVPGVSAILVWASLLTVLLARAHRQATGPWLFLAVIVFCGTTLVVFASHFEQWFAFLGEITVAAFALLALWIVAVEELSERSLLLAGLLIGLSLQTKPIAALLVPAFLVVVAARLRSASLDRRALRRDGALVTVACLLPTAAFEVIKLQQLGMTDYAAYTYRFLRNLAGQGVKWGLSQTLSSQAGRAGHTWILELLRRRIEVFQDGFAIHPVFLAAFLLLPLVLWRGLRERRWRALILGLAASIWCLGAYWLFISIGWPRYLVIAVAIGCFALCIPIVGLRHAWQRAGFTLAALALLAAGGGLRRLPLIVVDADNGLFRASSERLARAGVVAAIKDQLKRGPVILSSEGWASFVDVEFNLDGPNNFRRFDKISALPGRKLVLVNHRFPGTDPDMTREIRSRVAATLYSQEPYELLEIR